MINNKKKKEKTSIAKFEFNYIICDMNHKKKRKQA